MDPQPTRRREELPASQDALSSVFARVGPIFSLLFLVVSAIAFFEVVMRYAFDAPTTWVHETTTTLTALCFAFGGAYCLAIDKHIRVVLIYDSVGPRVRRWLDICISIVGFAACLLMAWAAWGLASKAFWTPSGEFRLETSGSAWNPPFPALVKGFLFLMLCAMAVQWALQAWRHIRRDPDDDVRHGEPAAGVFDDA